MSVRRTDQRAAIRRAVSAAQRPLSVQEIFEAAQAEVPGLGLATVYRNLKRLTEEGFLRTVQVPGEAGRYELAGLCHHHHFLCDVCGRMFDIPSCMGGLERMVPAGFLLRRHEVLLYGRCDGCAAQPEGACVGASGLLGSES